MPSFDIVSKVDLQEVNNSINSLLKELNNRYDFKGSKFTVILDEKEGHIIISAPDSYKLQQIADSLRSYSIKRNIDAKCYEFEKEEKASGDSLRQKVLIKQGIDHKTAKNVNKFIKEKKMKIQSSVRGEEIRVEGKKINDLQEIMGQLKSEDFGIVLQFINFR
ncbi:YajQ family cyclic di-GMP-binding protein [Flavobacteriaceae bacterium]|nr:YajQ family cyclic di-GMP-binding protein [Flavobacteriaceae bacterium]